MQNRRRSIRNLPMRAAAILLSIALMSLWMGCSTQERYKVLNFFFDGVPNPNAALASRGGGPNALAIVVTHKPYADNRCDECHTSGVSNLLFNSVQVSVSPTICLKCHQDIPHQYPVMHGPVAAVECTFCHAAHESNYPHLLWKPSPDVCMQCHTRELLSSNPPEHLMADSDCLRCHFGHGGTQHGMLRPDRPTWSPTTAPAAATPGGGPQ